MTRIFTSKKFIIREILRVLLVVIAICFCVGRRTRVRFFCSAWNIIINFSNRHKLHHLLALLYGLALARVFHEMV